MVGRRRRRSGPSRTSTSISGGARSVGIIGRNGAGKSTLLKILSRITGPTTGGIDIYGRIASLLEVGTGFHPELTGRENIYLNGRILGMRRREIKRKFDEIVDFAGVEKFLDTPVKRYSSGMYVRLAFAVAAHLEPEILIVDEVLAVGDAQFQQKCLGKMQEVARNEGRTVLFVSHNMASIATLAQNCLFLDEGRVAMYGPTDEVIGRYMAQFGKTDSIEPGLFISDTRAGPEPRGEVPGDRQPRPANRHDPDGGRLESLADSGFRGAASTPITGDWIRDRNHYWSSGCFCRLPPNRIPNRTEKWQICSSL